MPLWAMPVYVCVNRVLRVKEKVCSFYQILKAMASSLALSSFEASVLSICEITSYVLRKIC